MTISLKKIASAFAVLLLFQVGFTQQEEIENKRRKEIVGYYPNWQQ